jgi:hypothetical protein
MFCKLVYSVLALVLLFTALAAASEIQFSAQVDETKISLDSTVSLKMWVKSDRKLRTGEPQFDAPGFEVISQYNASSLESRFDSSNGGSVQYTQQFTKVLRPMKTGTFKISSKLNAGGKIYTGPDLHVQVIANSGGAQPLGGLGRRRDRSSNLSNQNTAGAMALVRAEVDKKSAFKGEQIIVSYYLYHRVKIFNVQIEKLPVLRGFLREDLEMPPVAQRSEQVTLNGVLYQRSLIARYAAYPLEEGKLDIDSMSLRYNYYSGLRDNSFDEEDPFFGFFQQMAPRVGSGESEKLEINVAPLPVQGKTEQFTGGIGDFNVVAALDKHEVRANEAVALSVKVEGKGNVAAIQSPQTQWPPHLELYDSKGKAQGRRGGGVGEKIFEYLLIPRQPGEITLPSIEFEFFDPVKKQYYKKSTDSFSLKINEPAPGTAIVPSQPAVNALGNSGVEISNSPSDDIRPLKAPGVAINEGKSQKSLLKILYASCIVLGLALIGLVLFDGLRAGKERRSQNKKGRRGLANWDQIEKRIEKAQQGGAWKDLVKAYEILDSVILDEIDKTFGISARSLSRAELQALLVENHQLDPQIWDRLSHFFEFSDLVRFASSSGGEMEKKSPKRTPPMDSRN